MIAAAMYGSGSCEWATPQALVDAIGAECGGFDLDPCAAHGLAKAPRYYTETDDGLRMPWWGRIWLNPPWSRAAGQSVEPWLCSAYQATRGGEAQCVYALVPARPDTKWWARWATRAHEVRFLQGRVKYEPGDGGQSWSAPFPSALLVYRRGPLPPSPAVWLSWRVS